MLDYVADHIFHKHILATWVEFEAGTLGLTLSSLTVVLTVTDMANGQWTVDIGITMHCCSVLPL